MEAVAENVTMSSIMPQSITPIPIAVDIRRPSDQHIRVVHVYSTRYRNFPKTTGFGDFIRGTYSLLQFGQMPIDLLVVNHPIAALLPHISTTQAPPDSDIPNLTIRAKSDMYVPHTITTNNGQVQIVGSKYNPHFNTRCQLFLDSITPHNNRLYVSVIYPPNDTPSPAHCFFMRQRLIPCAELVHMVTQTLQSLSLTAHQYSVIHLRLGDANMGIDTEHSGVNIPTIHTAIATTIRNHTTNGALNNTNINTDTDTNTTTNTNTNTTTNTNTNTKQWLLLTDSSNIKSYIRSQFPQIKMLTNPIIHTGENPIGDRSIDSLKNTMLEFYLMSLADHITSHTVYDHGSGFSRWCAITYGIPYVCYKLIYSHNI
jgi:hypothetical protein